MTAYFLTTNSSGHPVYDQLAALMSLFDSGTLVIYESGGSPPINPDVGFSGETVLATFTFSSTAFTQAAASGTFPNKTKVATASFSSSTVTAAADGTADSFGLYNSTPTLLATGTVGTSGADINFNSVAFSSGADITLSSFTLTLPE